MNRSAIACVLAMLLAACSEPPPQALGTLEYDRITLPAPAAERIVEIAVREGEQVQAGARVLTLEQVRGFVVAHQNSRFADWFDHTHRPANMVGYRKKEADGVSFIVLPSGWKEITIGRDPKRVAQLCLEAGYLLPSNDGKRVQRKIRLRDGSEPVWIYMLTERVLADEADGPEDE